MYARSRDGSGRSAEPTATRLRAKELKRALRNKGIDVSHIYERTELEDAMQRAGFTEDDLLAADEEEAFEPGEKRQNTSSTASTASASIGNVVQQAQRGADKLLRFVNEGFERRKQQLLSGELQRWGAERVNALDQQLNLRVKLRMLAQRIRFRWFRIDSKYGISSKVRLYGPPALRAVNQFRETPLGQVLQVAVTLWLIVSGVAFKLLGIALPLFLVTNAVAPNFLSNLVTRALGGTTLRSNISDSFSDSQATRGANARTGRTNASSAGPSSAPGGGRRDFSATGEVIDVEANDRD